MTRLIDPCVDYAFKELFGDPANELAFLSFLNAVLRPERPIVRLTILNPFNEREYEADRLTVVDVKAEDSDGAVYQIEVQVSVRPVLAHRMLYTWAQGYSARLSPSDPWNALKPVVCIWLLTGRLFPDEHHHHSFTAVDATTGVRLSDHLAIHVLELPKWHLTGPLDEEGKWMYFFREAKSWSQLPAGLDSPPLRLAMDVLHRISAIDADYERYRARANWLHEQASLEFEREAAEARLAEALREKADAEAAKADAEAAKADAEAAKADAEAMAARERAEKEAALLENARLRALIAGKG